MTIFDAPRECVICSSACEPTQNVGFWYFECPRCGPYFVPASELANLRLLLASKQADRGALAGFVRHWSIRNELPPTITTNALSSQRPGTVSLADAMATRPRLTGDVQDAVLVAVARTIGTPGGRMQLGESDTALAYTVNPQDFSWHVSQLLERGLLRHAEGNDVYNLRHAGWARVDEILRGATVDPTQAFVAMWFDASMDDAYANAIVPAVEAAGFRPYRIKDVEHNNKICDEILAAIRRSRFVVAEFTGNRGGVYFEAGFAMGLGLPVVWVVHESDLKDVHFDTNHFNHITWTTVEELRTRLQRRIEATISRPVKT